jgi:hypothetical protein
VSFAPDGTTLATACEAGTVRVWGVPTGKELHTVTLNQPKGGGGAVTFSPDTRTFARAYDTMVELRDTATGKLIYQLPGHRGPVLLLDYSPDGKTLAAGTATTMYLWEVSTGQQRLVLGEAGNRLTSFTFSPDGRALVSSQANLTVLLWDRFGVALVGQAGSTNPMAAKPDALWTELGSADAKQAYKAMAALIASPDQAAPLLREHLARTLAETPITPDLRAAEQLRLGRAIEVLEHLGTPAARQVLHAVGNETTNDSLRQEAQAALDRLARRGGLAP